MNFSFILNSRGRPSLLKNLIGNIVKNTDRLDLIEILVAIDNDDSDTLSFAKDFKENCPIYFSKCETMPNVCFLIGERPKSLCASYNKLASKATGKYIFVSNDDVEILTKSWDTIAIRKINDFKIKKGIKDDIIYCRTSDNSVDKIVGREYASFPIISKYAVDIIGMFMYPNFVGLGGDSSIYRVYDQIGRVIDIPEIQVDHLYHNTIFKVMSPDLTAFEMRQKTAEAGSIDPFTFDVSKEVEKLKAHIAHST